MSSRPFGHNAAELGHFGLRNMRELWTYRIHDGAKHEAFNSSGLVNSGPLSMRVVGSENYQ